jgi:hypothetical protein
LACQDEFVVKNPLDVKENDEYALDFALQVLFKQLRTAHAFFPK